ncbi:MAG: FG-GAP-like repeat-containing protein [Pyrinomonadaceae bacterium]
MKKNKFLPTIKKPVIFWLISAMVLTMLIYAAPTQPNFAAGEGGGNTQETNAPSAVENHQFSESGNEQRGQTILRIVGSSAFAEFDAWTNDFIKGNFRDDKNFQIEKGMTLAMERRELLKELIRLAPEAALEKAVSEETYNGLPASIVEHLERRVSVRGDFLISVFDPIEHSNEEAVASETRREVVIGNSRYEAFVYGRKEAMTTKLGIPLRGIVLDDLMAVNENSIEKIESDEFASRGVKRAKAGKNGIAAKAGGEIVYFSNRQEFKRYEESLTRRETMIAPSLSTFGEAAEQLSPWTEGAKSVLVIRVDFPDRAGEPVDRSGFPLTEARANSVINGSVNQFYVSNSYNKTSLSVGAVTPVLRMSHPQSYYTGFNVNSELLPEARAAARAAGYETNNYNLDVVAFSFTQNLSFSGSAIIGGKGLLLNGFFDFKTIAHEIGHNYGLVHANLWRTTDGTPSGTGANVEYGDAFDLMGGGASQITHFNAEYKRRLNWLTEANVQTVASSGLYSIFPFDGINSPNGIHALKIRRDANKNYWIETRQLFSATPTLTNAAFVRWDYNFILTGSQIERQTQLLDMTPATSSLADSPLQIGQTFADNANGITITVVGKGNTTPESLDVRVEINQAVIRGAPLDFDGDNKSDIAVFRPESGVWYLNQSTHGFRAIQWGLSTDKIVPAKFNSDRTTDIAVFRPETGVWYVYTSFGGNPIVVQFGQTGDIPVPADYDGDGFSEMAVYRPSNGVWYRWNWVFQRFSAAHFGISTDKPVPADYDGDGKIDVAVYRPETGVWYLLRSSQGFTAFQFGLSEDKPVVGDYDGDGRSDFAVYRPSNGVWYIQGSTVGFYGTQFGIETDQPAPGDYDGDGKTDPAVYRASEGVWYLLQSRNGFAARHFGVSTDRPVPGAFVW